MGDSAMKLIYAIVQPQKFEAVLDSLQRIEVTRMTICDAQGIERQPGEVEPDTKHEFTTVLRPKIIFEIVVNDDFLERTIEMIQNVARTGSQGQLDDGKIFVVPILDTIQVSDQSCGPGSV